MSTPAANVTTGRRGLWRWGVALVATVLLVVSGSGLVAFAQSGAGESRGPQFVPADAPIYIEARLDMPDGQGEALAEFLTAFPGFADTGTFETKADELIDGLVSEATDGALTYSGELSTFLTGEVGLAVGNLGEAAMANEDPEILIGLAISDRAAAESFLDLMTAGRDEPLVEGTYGDTSFISDGDMTIAVTDDWVLLSQTAEQVKAGIDVLEGTAPSLADSPEFAEAFSNVPTGHLAALYVDLRSFSSLIDLASMAASGQTGVALPTEALVELLPVDMVAYLAAGPKTMTMEALITPALGTPALAVGDSELATLFPADTQLYVETRAFGSLIETALTGLLETMGPEQAEQLAPFDDMLGVPLSSYLDFIDDAAFGASLDSDGLWVGMAGEVGDDAVAAMRVERLLSIIRLLGAGATDGEISIDESVVGGITVTTITLPIDDAISGAGLPIGVGDTIKVAIANGGILLGTGDFVENALTQGAVESLALSPGYVDALGEDVPNAGVAYAQIDELLSSVGPLLSLMTPEYADVQPYADALDRLMAIANTDEERVSTKITVYVD